MPNFTYVELEASPQSLSQGAVRTRGPVRTRGASTSPDVIGIHVIYVGDGICPIPFDEFEYELEGLDGCLRMRVILPNGYAPPPPSEAFLIPKDAPRKRLTFGKVEDRHALLCDQIVREKFYHLVLM